MLRGLFAALLTFLSFSFSLSLADEELWLHVRVLDGDEKVSVNLPFNLIETAADGFMEHEGDRSFLKVDDLEVDRKLLVAIVDAAKTSKDGVFVSVESDSETVKVAKKGDEIHVDINDHGEEVTVRIPVAIAEALLMETEGNELNLAAGLRELAKHQDKNLVTIKGDTEQVRVWVDSSQEGI